VFMIDDHRSILWGLERLIESGKPAMKVVGSAESVTAALKLLDSAQPDVILLDIEMPRMDGFEFARNVRADPKTKHIPIIMITSRTADKHRNRAMELGVNEYMGKPYQEEQLLQVIRQFTGQMTSA